MRRRLVDAAAIALMVGYLAGTFLAILWLGTAPK